MTTEVNNLFLINGTKLTFELTDDLKHTYDPQILEDVQNKLKIPRFYYYNNGSKLIIFIVKEKYNNYNVLIAQIIDDNKKRIMLYPEELDFKFEYKTKNAFIINPPNLSLYDISLKEKILLNELRIEYEIKNIDENFILKLLNNKNSMISEIINVDLPDDPNIIERLLNNLSRQDIINLRVISSKYKQQINNYYVYKIKQLFSELKYLDLFEINSMFVYEYFTNSTKINKIHKNISFVNLMAKFGYINVLKQLADKNIFPDVNGANLAAEVGDYIVLNWLNTLKDKYPSVNNVLPDKRGLNLAIGNGYLNIAETLIKYDIYPTKKAANLAAGNGLIHVLDWLSQLIVSQDVYTEKQSSSIFKSSSNITTFILPNIEGAYLAAESGQIKSLEWMFNKGILIKSNYRDIVNILYHASEKGQLETILWILKLLPEHKVDQYLLQKIFDIGLINGHINIVNHLGYSFNQNSIDEAAGKGHLHMLQWLVNNGYKFINSDAANLAYVNDHLNIVEWLQEIGVEINNKILYYAIRERKLELLDEFLDKGFHFTSEDANLAVEQGDVNLLIKIIQTNVFPNNSAALYSAYKGDVNMLNLLEEINIHVDNMGYYANNAVEKQQIDMLNWLAARNRFPLPKTFTNAYNNNLTESVKWLKEHNILPEPNTMNIAVSRNDYDFLNWAAERGVLPNDNGYYVAFITKNTDMLNWLNSKNVEHLNYSFE